MTLKGIEFKKYLVIARNVVTKQPRSSWHEPGLLHFVRNDGTVLILRGLALKIPRHCEERSDEATQGFVAQTWIASLRLQQRRTGLDN
jgi:hypothetical protein